MVAVLSTGFGTDRGYAGGGKSSADHTGSRQNRLKREETKRRKRHKQKRERTPLIMNLIGNVACQNRPDVADAHLRVQVGWQQKAMRFHDFVRIVGSGIKNEEGTILMSTNDERLRNVSFAV